MPRCIYSCPSLSQEAGAAFSTPKSVSSLEAWLGAATLALQPGNPWLPLRYERKGTSAVGGWCLSGDADVSPRSIAFTFLDHLGNRARLVIDRSFREYGR